MSATFCPDCGNRLVEAERAGKTRKTCGECACVEYQNPAVGWPSCCGTKPDGC